MAQDKLINFEKLKIKNSERYLSYTPLERNLFMSFRNPMLVLINKGDSKFDEEDLDFVESCAFSFVDKFPEEMKNPKAIILSIIDEILPNKIQQFLPKETENSDIPNKKAK